MKTDAQTVKLWLNYVDARKALLDQGIVRSFKQAESDFAEWLIANLFDGELPSSLSNPAYDVLAGNKRIQVKSIAKSPDNKHGYIVDKKKDRNNNPDIGATHYAFVFFFDLIPTVVFLVPEDFVRNFPKNEIKLSDLEKTTFKIPFDFFRPKNSLIQGTTSAKLIP